MEGEGMELKGNNREGICELFFDTRKIFGCI